MAINPLASHFRQPKIFVSLPSKGVYNRPGAIQGDVGNLAVYGMTGMDEIISKTPDALMTGQASIDVIKSCMPSISDPWELTALDTDLVFAAIRIATYGNEIHISNTCSNCSTENEYDIDLSYIMEHYNSVRYNNTLYVNDLILKTRPLTYKQMTEFNLKNYSMQQQVKQADNMEDPTEKQKFIDNVWKDLADLQKKLAMLSVESVEINGQAVTERGHIVEWLENCDREVTSAIESHIQDNRSAWNMPRKTVKCESCQHEDNLLLDLDQSNFFVKA